MSNEFWKYTSKQNLPQEVWFHINGYTNYAVSNFGRVKSLKSGNILKQTLDEYGQCVVGLNGNIEDVGTLVAETFIDNDNPTVNNEVIHINGCVTDNSVDNLQWGNFGEVLDEVLDELLFSEEDGEEIKPNISRQVYCKETNTVYKSIGEAARRTGKNQSGISRCCNKAYKHTGGYHFCFYDEMDK